MSGKKNWRLSKTLARRVEVRPIEDADVQYAWAAYKHGALAAMGLPENLDAAGFKSAFENYVLTNAEAAWTVSTDTPKGFMPTGFVLGGWAPRQSYMIIVGIVWFPWASRRNVLEGATAFFDRLRKQMPWMGYANQDHKKLYETLCMHGIMRRIGTSETMGNRLAVFEGRN